MTTKYLEKLEYFKIIDILKNFCVTHIGKNLALNLLPYYKKDLVEKELEETSNAYTLIFQKGNLPIYEISNNIDSDLRMLEFDSILSIRQVLDVTNVLRLGRELREYFALYKDEIKIDFSDCLNKYFNNLYTNKDIEEKIFKNIIDENTLDDHASPDLYSIRKKQGKIDEAIHNKLNSMLSSKYVQEPIVTIRNNRYVIPIKQEYRGEVKGFIQDISTSGATVFIEPTQVFDLNNELNDLKLQESLEIEKILSDYSKMLKSIVNYLRNNLTLIAKIDFIFAKAKYAISVNAYEPKINNEHYIDLINARHPLISKDTVVPININLGKTFDSLIITGPNTGGKTVSLKTTGLLVAMAMSGLFIPANENSSIYIFDNIFADIGDNQNIQESLSTFSSHMSNIVEVCNSATKNSLVLFDELGSGTDPIEGSALAISVLKYLYNIKALTVSTTHYTELKTFALTNEGFENACSDFDIETLTPTYKLLIGIPGKSNAFDISKKLGLRKEILDDAYNLLDKNNIDFENMLKKLYNDKLLIETEKDKILKTSKEVETLKQELLTEKKDKEVKAEKLLNNAKLESRELLLNTKELVNTIIKELNEKNISLKEANELRNKLNKNIQNLEVLNNAESNVSSLNSETFENDADSIKLGMKVFVPKFNDTGIINSLPNKSNEVLITIGNIKTKVKLNEINKIKETVLHKGKLVSKVTHNISPSNNVSNEINVIGYNLEDAIWAVDKYLDTASLSSLNAVRIVHGKGTGILRKGIQNYLKTNKHVKSFRTGSYGEGEMGVTIVELK